jgi:hypothetical protein
VAPAAPTKPSAQPDPAHERSPEPPLAPPTFTAPPAQPDPVQERSPEPPLTPPTSTAPPAQPHPAQERPPEPPPAPPTFTAPSAPVDGSIPQPDSASPPIPAPPKFTAPLAPVPVPIPKPDPTPPAPAPTAPGPTALGPTTPAPAAPAPPEPAPPPAAVISAQPAAPPVPGSRADLKLRLERLPFGHPSSPYHVDGERKPPPPRLKHLELAPPAPNRFAAAAARALASQPTASTPTARPPTVLPPDDEPGFSLPVDLDDDAADPAHEPPTPQSNLDGSWSWGSASLTSDQVRVANEAYDRLRLAEGRSLFGGYSAGGLTPTMQHVAANLEAGTLAPETEQTALLDPDTFKARFSDMLRRYPDRTPDRLARRVPGAISYAFIFDGELYSAGIWIVHDALTAQGFRLLARRNDWNATSNRCVATMWQDPTHDVPFQVEFHTTASLEAKQLAKTSATLINDPRIPSAEAAHLESGLAAAWAALPPPPGNTEIGNYRRENGGPAQRSANYPS